MNTDEELRDTWRNHRIDIDWPALTPALSPEERVRAGVSLRNEAIRRARSRN